MGIVLWVSLEQMEELQPEWVATGVLVLPQYGRMTRHIKPAASVSHATKVRVTTKWSPSLLPVPIYRDTDRQIYI